MKKKYIHFGLLMDEYDKLKAMAEEEKRTVVGMLRVLICRAAEKK